MEFQELRQKIDTNEIETVFIVSGDLLGRPFGKRVTGSHFLRCYETGVSLCTATLCMGPGNRLRGGYSLSNWENGFPDFRLIPDLNTCRLYPIFPKTALVIGDLYDQKMNAVKVSPRHILQDAVRYMDKLGFTSRIASELEFYVLEESVASATGKGFHNLQLRAQVGYPDALMNVGENEDFLLPLRQALQLAEVDVEMVKTESKGQYEVNLAHMPPVEAADRHLIFKMLVKEFAQQKQVTASFMPRIDETLSPCGCHIHLSLHHQDGNAFSDPMAPGNLRHFLAGLMQCSPDLLLFYAPTVNSYRRFEPNTFAPHALTWGEDNRTVAFRTVGQGSNRRIENRIPGADANPYLAYTAMLYSGGFGLDQRLNLNNEAVQGNGYLCKDAQLLAKSILQAQEQFGNSNLIREMFPKDVVEHFTLFAQHSWEDIMSVVTNQERKLLLFNA